MSGLLSALFLWSLDRVTALRFTHPELVFFLPAAGIFMVWVYRRWGADSERGNAMILERIRQHKGRVPARMAVLIFGSSILSHLVGASTGREGAAVQIGGGLAAFLLKLGNLNARYGRPMLVAGAAAGFSSIFGTPLAGALFAIEAPAPKQPLLHLLPLALVASFAGDTACRASGATHALYHVQTPLWSSLIAPKTLAALLLASLLFGWAGHLFIRMHLGVRFLYAKLSGPWWWPPALGGILLIAASHSPLLTDYLGLGTWSPNAGAVTIASAFSPGGASDLSWIAKLSLTALSLGSGFKGGEVTPLFFAGATLGNTFATHLNLAPDLFAALGFVAVFTGAAHTPLAGAVLAAELFGFGLIPLFLPVCWLAHLTCGKIGLYPGHPLGHSAPTAKNNPQK
ncbi:MAG: H+/Cl- antiporter ClcA [Verrucomicrobia bacterium]|nr:MAG: H+/Cl- antiporter ClcA [Verrucomicrobiota bacterium]